MKIRSLKLGLLAALLAVTPLSNGIAQGGGRGERARIGGRGGGRGDRQEMEQRFRRQLAQLLRTQLGLNDDGMRQLSEVNQRFDQQRRELIRREMMTRRAMRDEVLKQDSADQGRTETLLAEQFKLERERIDITEAEQRELAKFLTPVQRAKYLAVQEQVRRQMDQMRGRAGEPAPGGMRGRRPPPA